MVVSRHFFHRGAQAILDAAALHRLKRNADVARQHAHPHRVAYGLPAVTHPQAATRKLHPHQVPGGIAFSHLGIQHHAHVFTQLDGQVQTSQGFTQRPGGHGTA